MFNIFCHFLNSESELNPLVLGLYQPKYWILALYSRRKGRDDVPSSSCNSQLSACGSRTDKTNGWFSMNGLEIFTRWIPFIPLTELIGRRASSMWSMLQLSPSVLFWAPCPASAWINSGKISPVKNKGKAAIEPSAAIKLCRLSAEANLSRTKPAYVTKPSRTRHYNAGLRPADQLTRWNLWSQVACTGTSPSKMSVV